MVVKLGRPSDFTEEIAEKICEMIASGISLRKVCKKNKMPHIATVMRWLLKKENKGFREQYELACNTRAELMFDELEEIADTKDDKESPNRSRLRVDTRKWYLSKVLPKKFGDKLDLTTKDKALPSPIYGGISRHDGDKEDIPAEEKN